MMISLNEKGPLRGLVFVDVTYRKRFSWSSVVAIAAAILSAATFCIASQDAKLRLAHLALATDITRLEWNLALYRRPNLSSHRRVPVVDVTMGRCRAGQQVHSSVVG